MPDVLRLVSVVGWALLVAVVVGWAAGRVLRRLAARHAETPLWPLLRRCLPPLRVVLFAALLDAGYGTAELTGGQRAVVRQVLTLVLIAACAWLVARFAVALTEATYVRYAAGDRDEARLRRVRTQVTIVQRAIAAVVGVVAVAAMLLTFPAMRTVGASVLASAGLIGIVAGVAAQSTLANLFAGLQIAFGDVVRIGDTVVVGGDWGKVEEITLTYLVLKTWDERRVTMPVSYFTSRPFENWSRGDPRMTGAVFLHLDHAAPVDLLREQLHRILLECPEWDGRAWSLVVTDSTPTTIQVRALVTAGDGDDIWTLRCVVRERLVEWLRRTHPYALPRLNTAPAPGLEDAPHRRQTPPTGGDIGPGPGPA
ncbi:mechanosensitive ion channel family protein [Streptomyces gamaensis]|uniref:Mechanosensitive ion channel family protein n=1 Tax=Streptomyces gamaensis TaxID=1763542 RepID=A0ABW0Z7S2_9ACTN